MLRKMGQEALDYAGSENATGVVIVLARIAHPSLYSVVRLRRTERLLPDLIDGLKETLPSEGAAWSFDECGRTAASPARGSAYPALTQNAKPAAKP